MDAIVFGIDVSKDRLDGGGRPSGEEFALARVRRSRVEEQVEEGVRGARLVLTQLDDLSRCLAACQLGITLTSLGIGFLGEPAIASIFEDLFGTSISHDASLVISLASFGAATYFFLHPTETTTAAITPLPGGGALQIAGRF
jgi:CBS domain containing-hemolysin-like protein